MRTARYLLVAVGLGLPLGIALKSLSGLIGDAQLVTTALMQWMSEPVSAQRINTEIGDLAREHLGGRPLFSFARYDLQLDRDWLADEAGVTVSERELAGLRRMDRADLMAELYDIAATVAERAVTPEVVAWATPAGPEDGPPSPGASR